MHVIARACVAFKVSSSVLAVSLSIFHCTCVRFAFSHCCSLLDFDPSLPSLPRIATSAHLAKRANEQGHSSDSAMLHTVVARVCDSILVQAAMAVYNINFYQSNSPHKEDARPPSPVEVFEVEEPSWETIVEDSATSWPQQTSPCFFLESKYEPLNMPGYGRTRVRSPEQCQARCSKARGCAYFTAFQIQPDLYWAIAGPGDCNQEAILLEAMGQRIPAPTTTQAPKRAPPVSPPAPRPPMARASRPKVEQQPAPAPLAPPAPPLIVKEPQTAAPDKEQDHFEVELAVPDVGADGSLTILLIVLVAAGAVSFSGRVERS
eukprot:g14127.t1